MRYAAHVFVGSLVAMSALVGAAGCASDGDDDDRVGRRYDRDYDRKRPARASENFQDRDRDGIRDGLEDRDRDGVRDGNENRGRNRRDPDMYR